MWGAVAGRQGPLSAPCPWSLETSWAKLRRCEQATQGGFLGGIKP